MFKKIVLFLLCCVSIASDAQLNTAVKAPNSYEQGRLRVSLITCGPGDDIWEVFGHACIRVVDSARSDSFSDVVFNYGMFDFNHANFFIKIAEGTLPYYLGIMPFSMFKRIFEERKRSMFEQDLMLDVSQKKQLVAFLAKNALPENREYKYDFLVNNCSTCLRDVFQNVYGPHFVFGDAMPASGKITYRDISDQYAFRKPLERFGVYIFLGSTMDKVIDNREIMFIPDYLGKAVAGATLDGKAIASPAVPLLPGNEPTPDAVNMSFVLCCLLAVPAIAGLSNKKWRKMGKIMSNFLLVLTGIIGCIILFFSLGSDHLCAHSNYNPLWAFPVNLIIPFLADKWKWKVSLVGVLFICLAIVVHLLRIQVMPLFELSPLLVGLLLGHGMNYRISRATSTHS